MEKLQTLNHNIRQWLSGNSKFYSRICQEPTSRRQVIYSHGVTVCIIIAAIAVNTNILAAFLAAMSATWLAWRWNTKEIQEKTNG